LRSQNGAIQLRAQPSIVTGSMRAYQLEGLNWYVALRAAVSELAMLPQWLRDWCRWLILKRRAVSRVR